MVSGVWAENNVIRGSDVFRFAVDIHLIQGMLQGDGFCVTIKAQTVLMVRLDSSRIWQVVGAPKLNKSCIPRAERDGLQEHKPVGLVSPHDTHDLRTIANAYQT